MPRCLPNRIFAFLHVDILVVAKSFAPCTYEATCQLTQNILYRKRNDEKRSSHSSLGHDGHIFWANTHIYEAIGHEKMRTTVSIHGSLSSSCEWSIKHLPYLCPSSLVVLSQAMLVFGLSFVCTNVSRPKVGSSSHTELSNDHLKSNETTCSTNLCFPSASWNLNGQEDTYAPLVEKMNSRGYLVGKGFWDNGLGRNLGGG